MASVSTLPVLIFSRSLFQTNDASGTNESLGSAFQSSSGSFDSECAISYMHESFAGSRFTQRSQINLISSSLVSEISFDLGCETTNISNGINKFFVWSK